MVELSAEKISSSILWQTVCEAEYIVALDAMKEAVWLKKFIIDLGVAPFLYGLFLLYYDSSRATA